MSSIVLVWPVSPSITASAVGMAKPAPWLGSVAGRPFTDSWSSVVKAWARSAAVKLA